MPHGGGHGHHHEVDLEAEFARELPPPYCRGKWRPTVGALAVMAVIVAGVGVEEHFRQRAEATMAPDPTMIATAPVPATAPVQPVAMASATWGVTPAGLGANDPNVHFVAGATTTPFNTAAQRIRPSVVGIRAALGARGPGQPMVERIGSGVVVGDGQYIVTCRHVVEGAMSIAASEFGGRAGPHAARLVASDADLALLQMTDGARLDPAPFSSSDAVQVGDWVLAVGHPFGLGLTVTAGIVGRRHGELAVPGGQRYTGLLQTDAPINEGSSGGPLVDLQGNVVGLNTAIYAPTGVFSGAGFAIPSRHISDFLARTLGGTAMNPVALPAGTGGGWLGLALSNLPPVAMGSPAGTVVRGVVAGGPAQAAGLRAGDVLSTIGGQAVPDVAAVHQILARLRAGDQVTVQFSRAGLPQAATLQTGRAPG